MATKKDKPIADRIKAEKSRLSKIYSAMDEDRKAMAMGLVERAAFMRVQLEDLEADLLANGWTEL